MKQGIITIMLLCMAVTVSGQKSRVMAVMQMIDAEQYEEAKEAIDLALKNEKSSKWYRTYYAKGLLCQTAYETGVKKNEPKKINLYPDQLFLAYESYETAVELDVRKRLHTVIGQKYYMLGNDFRSMGEELYTKSDYEGALRAFEYALKISKNELITVKTDTSLVYNTAMAAYQGKNWGKAIEYLTELQKDAYSPGSCVLLAMAWYESGDTLKGDEVLTEGVESYGFEEPVVMFLVNQLVDSGREEQALGILDRAVGARPEEFRFYWARGLVHQGMNHIDEAIADFLKAAELSPDSPEIYYHLGVCYYNMGIEQRESALKIRENNAYMQARERYLEKFREAVRWLERSYQLDPQNEETASTLNLLYFQLQMKNGKDSSQQPGH